MGTPAPEQPGRGNEPSVVTRAADERVSSDRRGCARKSLIGSRLVTVRLGSEGSGIALDLSQTGMGIRAFPGLRVGSTAALTFELPDLNHRIEVQGLVTWAERTGSLWSKGSGGRVGLRFTNLSESARAQVRQWLASERESFPPPPALLRPAPAADVVADLRLELRRRALLGEAALQWLVERLLHLLGATGAAVGFDDGQGIVCRATLGNAPDLGARIHGGSGLSGECVRTGQLVRCDDTETDPRVDLRICRELNLRSALIFPLYRQHRMCGVLEVFSAAPHAFGEEALALMRRVSELLLETAAPLLPPAQPPLAAGVSPTTAGTLGPAPAAVTAASASLRATPEQLRKRPRPPVKTAALADVLVCDVCGFNNARGDRVCARCDVPLSVVENYLGTPTAEDARAAEAASLIASRAAQLADEAGFPRLSEVTGLKRRRLWGQVFVIVVIAALLLAGFVFWRGRSNSANQAKAPAAELQPPPSAASPSELANRPVPLTDSPQIPAESVAAANFPAKVSAELARKPPKPAISPAPRPKEQDGESENVRWVMIPTPKLQPVTPPAPATLQSGNLPLPRLPQAVVIPEQPKALAGAKPGVAATGTLTGGRLIHRVEPEYPELAKRTGHTGTVVLSGTINSQGMIEQLRVLSGDPIFAPAALAAVRQWRYEPYRLDGRPFEVEARITLTFK